MNGMEERTKSMKMTEKNNPFMGGFTISDYNKWTERFNEFKRKNSKSSFTTNPLDIQCGGSHYKNKAIQPIEYIFANKLGFAEGNIVKYITRWRDKGGVQDLEKIKHYCDLLINEEKELRG